MERQRSEMSPQRGLRSTERGESPSRRLVLFVCVENTFRSVLSEAIFNAHAPPDWKAVSAGVQPATAVNPLVIDLLGEIGFEVGAKTPQLVTEKMISAARRVVTFGCLDRCPINAKDKSVDWPIPAATGKTFVELRAIRDELRCRIDGLVAEIEGAARKCGKDFLPPQFESWTHGYHYEHAT